MWPHLQQKQQAFAVKKVRRLAEVLIKSNMFENIHNAELLQLIMAFN